MSLEGCNHLATLLESGGKKLLSERGDEMAEKRGYPLRGVPPHLDFDNGETVSFKYMDPFGSIRYVSGKVVGYDFRVQPEIVLFTNEKSDWPEHQWIVALDSILEVR